MVLTLDIFLRKIALGDSSEVISFRPTKCLIKYQSYRLNLPQLQLSTSPNLQVN